ncbi:hypothetical protein [Xanthomonas sp. NCPPB 2632]|uniref:hypothetical protein n=1 Tax=Xanthomonas sp. NCPPB 2632 TaxID=3240912 RepID=UPI00351230AF
MPTDLRDRVGSRFLARPLRQVPGESARLAAALLDMALSNAFRRMRQGGVVVDIDSCLKTRRTLSNSPSVMVRLPSGTHLTNVRIDTPEDERQFRDLMAASTPSSPAQTARGTASLEREGTIATTFLRIRWRCT